MFKFFKRKKRTSEEPVSVINTDIKSMMHNKVFKSSDIDKIIDNILCEYNKDSTSLYTDIYNELSIYGLEDILPTKCVMLLECNSPKFEKSLSDYTYDIIIGSVIKAFSMCNNCGKELSPLQKYSIEKEIYNKCMYHTGEMKYTCPLCGSENTLKFGPCK